MEKKLLDENGRLRICSTWQRLSKATWRTHNPTPFVDLHTRVFAHLAIFAIRPFDFALVRISFSLLDCANPEVQIRLAAEGRIDFIPFQQQGSKTIYTV